MSVVTCRDCGGLYTAAPVKWRGRNLVPSSGICANCDEQAERERARQGRAWAWEANQARSGLPADLRGRKLDTGNPVGQAALDWATGKIPLLVLTGPVGVGKTYVASAAIRRAWLHRPVRWVAVARAMGQLQGAFGDEDRAAALRALNGDDSVVLDDLDKVPGTEAGLSRLFGAIDSRIASGAPTLVTMNTSIGELAAQIDRSKGAQLGQAVASRLSGGMVIRMTGPDRRMAA